MSEETSYYKQLVNEIGQRCVRLEEERRRSQIDANLARRVLGLALSSRRESAAQGPLAVSCTKYLESAAAILMADLVVVFRWQPETRSLVVEHQHGGDLPAAAALAMPGTPPVFDFGVPGSLPSPWLASLCLLVRAGNLGFCFDPQSTLAICVARHHSSNVQLPFGPADREIIAAALDGFLTLCREREVRAALLEAKELSERANRVKSEFLSIVSHELKTPLNAMIGFSEIARDLADKPAGNDQLVEYLNEICAASHNLLMLVNDILDLSRLELGKIDFQPVWVDLTRVVRSELRVFDVLAQRAELVVNANLEPDCRVFGDERRLRQIVSNLLSNAVKFNKRAGTVTVSVRGTPGETGIALTVEDTGIGIKGSDLPRITEPFFQADSSYDRRYQGTGLGLAIVRRLMDLHRGMLAIDSTVGAGTRVSLFFPACPDDEPLPNGAFFWEGRALSGRPTSEQVCL